MTVFRIRSILLAGISTIVGFCVVLSLHWAWRTPEQITPAFSSANSARTTSPSVDRSRYSGNPAKLVSSIYGHSKLQHSDGRVTNIRRMQSTARSARTVSPLEDIFPHPLQCHGQPMILTTDNIFLYHAICNITNGNDIAQFSGHSMSHLFDKANTKLHYTINEKLRTWSEVAAELNHTNALGKDRNIINGAVHMHNTHKLGDFMLLFWNEYFRFGPNGKALKQGRDATPLTSAQFTWAIEKNQPPVVITNWGDENWGHLSAPIGTRTTKWLNLTNHLRIHNSNYETVRMLLDSPKVVLMVTNTHVAPGIGNHTKIICLPLGMKAKQAMLKKSIKLLSKPYKKTTILRINNSGWGDRTKINALVSQAFNNTIQNSYSLSKSSPSVDHHFAAAQARFVLCPSGLGFDTYRLWETLLVGSIPIVESNAGLDRTYSNLPVLVVRNYTDVTPDLLHRAYPCFVRNAHKYNYKHLTQSYWLNLIDVAISTGKVDHVTKEHPFRNMYCDFL